MTFLLQYLTGFDNIIWGNLFIPFLQSSQGVFVTLAICVCIIILLILTNLFTLFKKHSLSKTMIHSAILPTEYKMLGDLAIEHGKFQLAERCYRRVAELEPTNTQIHYEIGEFLFQNGRYEEAIKEFEIVLNSTVFMPEIYTYLACAYQAVQAPQQAEKYYQKALKETPHVIEKLNVFHYFKHQKIRLRQHL